MCVVVIIIIVVVVVVVFVVVVVVVVVFINNRLQEVCVVVVVVVVVVYLVLLTIDFRNRKYVLLLFCCCCYFCCCFCFCCSCCCIFFLLTTTTPTFRECWFLMDSRWLTAWSNFVRSSSCSNNNNNNNNTNNTTIDQGEDPPGPVSSRQLLDSSGSPLPNLEAKIDYRAVTPLVFYLFVELYGKDNNNTPAEICRYQVDIYSVPVSVSRLVTIQRTALARAAVEVNGIRSKWMKWDIYPEEVGGVVVVVVGGGGVVVV